MRKTIFYTLIACLLAFSPCSWADDNPDLDKWIQDTESILPVIKSLFNQPEPEEPGEEPGEEELTQPPKPSEPIIIKNLGQAMGLAGPDDFGDHTKIATWSRLNGPHLKYAGFSNCDRGLEIFQRAVNLTAITVYQETGHQLSIGDGNQPYRGDCEIEHRGNHPYASSVFDINIPLNVPGVTRYNYDGSELVEIWSRGPTSLYLKSLKTELIDWESIYLFITRVNKFAQESAFRCLMHGDIRDYVLKRVKGSYGKDAYKELRLLIQAEPGHDRHIHFSLGKAKIYGQKFWGISLN